MQYLLVILNCARYAHKANKQRATWLKSVHIPWVHVIGQPDLETPYRWDFNTQTLVVKAGDDYLSLPAKTIRAYRAAIETFPDLQYVFKTDDDQHMTDSMFFPKLLSVLQRTSPNYGGNPIHIRTLQSSSYHQFHPELPKNMLVRPGIYCNGRFYLLSRKAIHILLSNEQRIEHEMLEDYAIGQWLPNQIKFPILRLDTNAAFIDSC